MTKLSLCAVSVGALLVSAAVPVSLQWSPATGPSFSIDRAEARVGRPATPGSVAGVARRQDRRAVYGAAAVGAAAAGGAYYSQCGYFPYPPC